MIFSLSYGILCHYGNFLDDTSYEYNTIMDVDEFIHWPKPYLLLSATCDEILSWIIEIWMENHLVSVNISNIVNL